MFARIEKIKDGKVTVNGEELTLEEVKKLPIFRGLGRDEKGQMYVILGTE